MVLVSYNINGVGHGFGHRFIYSCHGVSNGVTLIRIPKDLMCLVLLSGLRVLVFKCDHRALTKRIACS